MRSGPRLRAALSVATLTVVATGLVGVGPVPVVSVRADEVDDQRARVEQLADELDALDNRLGELEESHAAALDRIDQLTIEIRDQQAAVDAQSAQLGVLQAQLVDIAIDSFMSAGTTGLTPLFSSAAGFIDDLERDELSRVALDQGAGTSDELTALVEQLAEDKAELDAAKAEQDQLLASLEQQRVQGEQLAAELQQKYRAAEAELGQLIVEEQQRRAAEEAAAAQARFAAAAAAAAGNSSNGNGNASSGGTGGARGGGSTGGTGGGATGGTGGGSGGGSGGGTPAPAPDPAPSVPAPSGMAGVAISAAMSQLGVPYRFAKSEPGVAFDCSGLTKYAWGKAGVSLPHQSAAQYAATPRVPKDQAQPGDLIFYHSPIGHVAIYLGNDQLIHAPATGDVVKVSRVNWSKVVGVSRPG